MLLKNYWEWKKSLQGCTPRLDDGYSLDDQSTTTNLKATDGTTISTLYIMFGGTYYATSGVNNTFLLKNLSPAVGNGETDPTLEDYALGNTTSSNFSSLALSFTFTSPETYKTRILFVISGTNSSGTDQVITEAGVLKKINTSSSASKNVLFIKEKLATPITVPAGSSFRVEIEFADDSTIS